MSESGDVNTFRSEVAECEKEAQTIKGLLRNLGPQSDDEENNTLTFKLLKVSSIH
jgi:hypothetical protein